MVLGIAKLGHGLVVKGLWGIGEENSWCFGRFKDFFRYRFGRLYSEDRRFKFIPRGET